jgi:hypothetical protein
MNMLLLEPIDLVSRGPLNLHRLGLDHPQLLVVTSEFKLCPGFIGALQAAPQPTKWKLNLKKAQSSTKLVL